MGPASSSNSSARVPSTSSDVQVIVGLDGDEAAFGCDLTRTVATLIGVWTNDDDLCSVGFRAHALQGWGIVRHHDDGGKSQELCGSRNRLCMVA